MTIYLYIKNKTIYIYIFNLSSALSIIWEIKNIYIVSYNKKYLLPFVEWIYNK